MEPGHELPYPQGFRPQGENYTKDQGDKKQQNIRSSFKKSILNKEQKCNHLQMCCKLKSTKKTWKCLGPKSPSWRQRTEVVSGGGGKEKGWQSWATKLADSSHKIRLKKK